MFKKKGTFRKELRKYVLLKISRYRFPLYYLSHTSSKDIEKYFSKAYIYIYIHIRFPIFRSSINWKESININKRMHNEVDELRTTNLNGSKFVSRTRYSRYSSIIKIFKFMFRQGAPVISLHDAISRALCI